MRRLDTNSAKPQKSGAGRQRSAAKKHTGETRGKPADEGVRKPFDNEDIDRPIEDEENVVEDENPDKHSSS